MRVVPAPRRVPWISWDEWRHVRDLLWVQYDHRHAQTAEAAAHGEAASLTRSASDAGDGGADGCPQPTAAGAPATPATPAVGSATSDTGKPVLVSMCEAHLAPKPVCASLFKPDAWEDPALSAQVAAGVARVAAWRARGTVPVAVEATATLMDLLRKPCGPRDSGSLHPRSDIELRLSLSMCLVRLVNGISDAEQKGAHAASVASLTQRVGLPPQLVGLRHGATHNELPSLVVLWAAADSALQWLRHWYWDRQAADADDSVRGMHAYEAIRRYLETREARESIAPSRYTTDSRFESGALDDDSAVAVEHIKSMTTGGNQGTNLTFISNALVPSLFALANGLAIPLASSKFLPMSPLGFHRLRCRWGPLLLACQRKWADFTAVAVRYLVMQLLSAKDLNVANLPPCILFAQGWVSFLVSNDWTSVALPEAAAPECGPIRQAQEWSGEQAKFMSSLAPRSMLEALDIPLRLLAAAIRCSHSALAPDLSRRLDIDPQPSTDSSACDDSEAKCEVPDDDGNNPTDAGAAAGVDADDDEDMGDEGADSRDDSPAGLPRELSLEELEAMLGGSSTITEAMGIPKRKRSPIADRKRSRVRIQAGWYPGDVCTSVIGRAADGSVPALDLPVELDNLTTGNFVLPCP